MTEKLLQYIWQFQYFNLDHLTTTESEAVQIIYPGKGNYNQGPDFLEARIKIDQTILIGSVELHLKTSDWRRHNHGADGNYNNTILHVVFRHDENSCSLPVLELEPRISKLLLERFAQLMRNTAWIPCAPSIRQVKEITLLAWKERLLAERLTRKSNNIAAFQQENNNHWEETFWWQLARNFGIKVNADAFEELARSIPVGLLAKHKNQIHQLEALLFGQANLLNQTFTDDYPQLLQREYRFLQKKYSLQPIHIPLYFLRMRPANFPTVRLAQLAMLVHSATHLFSKLLETAVVEDVKQWLSVTANDYWHYHYRFDELSEYKPKKLGADMSDNIVINTLAPMLFAYGLQHKEESHQVKALHWLTQTDPEVNTITTNFKRIALINKNAFDSQSLIELKTNYCNHKRCLQCAVGNTLLKNPVIIARDDIF